LHGVDNDFLINRADREAFDKFNMQKAEIEKQRLKDKRLLKSLGIKVVKSHALDFLDEYQENIIDVFFLFLFLVITYHSYKKLLLKFTKNSIKFLKHNLLINKSNFFNIKSYKRFIMLKRFYKKFFIKFYLKLITKVKINSSAFFFNKMTTYIDRSII
jgi:hypothetical protein